MHVSITRCDTSSSPEEDGPIVGEEMDGWLTSLEGYRGLMLLTREGETLGLAFWETEELAAKHGELRAEFRERMLAIAGVRILGVEGYDVAFSRVDGLGEQ
jgi:hypothetical protein